MKKNLLFLFSIVFLINFSFAQTEKCLILTDSVIGGESATSFEKYIYNDDFDIIKIEKTDSNQNMVSDYDTLSYDLNGNLILVEEFRVGEDSPNEVTTISYTDNKISSIKLDGDNGNGPWSMTHDISYSASGQIESVILNESSISGEPEGFNASFENFVWTNGNVTNIDLIGDLGSGTIDTIELTLTYDEKKNFERLQYLNEAPDLIMQLNKNNLLEMIFDNNEGMGGAGTIAMKRSFTYYDNDEVMIATEHPGVFNNDSSVHKLRLDCFVDINETLKQSTEVLIYPNPANEILIAEIKNGFKHAKISIFSIIGSRLYEEVFYNSDQINIDISSFPTGIYFINIKYDTHFYSTKISKE